MFKRLVQLFFLLVLVAVAGLVWFSWYASTPLLVPVGAAESSVPASGESMIMEPVEAVSADGTAISGYLVRPRLVRRADAAPEPSEGRPEAAGQHAASG